MEDALHNLLEAFRGIDRERMATMPFYNPRLEVEPVGFDSWDGHLAGVLIAPWLMNLVVLPGEETWQDLDPGSRVELSLPAGRYEFTTCRLPEAGLHLSLPLFTGVKEFPDQATARQIAAEVRSRLFGPPAGGTAQTTAPRRALNRRAFLGITTR